MAIHTCRSGDRSFQRITSVENDLAELHGTLEQWQTFTPRLWATRSITGDTPPEQWSEVNLGTGAIRQCWFMRIGHRLQIRYVFQWGQPPWYAAPGRIATELPPGLAGESSASQYMHAHLWTTSGTEGEMNFAGSALVHAVANRYVQPMFPFHAQDCRLGHYAIAGPADGQRDWSVPYIRTGFPEGGLLDVQGTLNLA